MYISVLFQQVSQLLLFRSEANNTGYAEPV